MDPPPRKMRRFTEGTLPFNRTPIYQSTPEMDSPEPATRPKRRISQSPSASTLSASTTIPIPSTEGDDNDDEELETRESVPASTRCTFIVLLERPELSGYRRCFRSDRRLGGNKVSWICLHGVELEKKASNGKWIKHWICRHCHKQGRIKVMNAQAPTNCTRYLHDQHDIGLERLKEKVQAQGQIEEFVDKHLWEEMWREDYLNWIAKDDITLSQATSPHCRRLLTRSGPKVANLLPQRSCTRRWLLAAYEQRKPEVIEFMRTSLSKVSLSFDGWFSPNDLSIRGVVAHWIDRDCTLRNALIGMPRLEGQHFGENIAKVVSSLIYDYGAQHKVGASVLDNATNNDTAVGALAHEFGLDPAQCRLRCWGHTVNRVVKALLFGEGLSAFQKELKDAGDEESFKIWRRQHAIGKLHNVVRYIMRSDQRIQVFNESERDVADEITTFCYRLVRDTGIRWNSVYNMITRALLLEKAIRSYCRQWRKANPEAYDLSQDFLDDEDWEELRYYEELLLPFKLATERLEGKGNKLSLEGSHGAVWEVLPAFDFLFMMLKIRADDVSKNPDLFVDHYRHCINHGFEKLKEYYGKTDQTRLYRAAIALHPCYRNDYFANAWAKVPRSKSEIKNAQTAVTACHNDFLDTLRKSEDNTGNTSNDFPADSSINEVDDVHAQFNNFSNTVRRNATAVAERGKKKRKREDSELDRFLELSLEDLCVTDVYKNQPIAWWRDHGRRTIPTLAKLAFMLLAIPGMSAECERAFSQAKRMITDEQFHLKQDLIEAEQCIRSWLINKVADGQKAWDLLRDVRPVNNQLFYNQPNLIDYNLNQRN